MIGATGVVYGDIGTGVLYAIKEVFHTDRVLLMSDNIHGILLMFFEH